MKIGVFDSGVGGLSVANSLQRAYPEHEIVYAEDREHVPYGTRPVEEIMGFVVPIFQGLANQGCQVIVIACNTVSTTLAPELRRHFAIPLVAMEPMVKPAAEQTASKVVAVCATPRTLGSERYRWLKETYAQGVKVLEPDCSNWAAMIEHSQVEDEVIAAVVDDVCGQGADVIVLGCTHYHWIEDKIYQMAQGRAKVLQPEQAIVSRLRTVLDGLTAAR